MSEGAGHAFGALEKGTMIDGKYAIERILGEGGMGVVYLARDVHAEAPVVLKAIRAEHTHRQDFRDRILAEGRALARIDHPNIVRLNAIVIEPGGNLYLVMQFIEGESLDLTIKRHAREGRPSRPREALRIFRDVLSGIAAVHREGIIHRDIKPANILVRARDGAVKVTDFGIAKPEEDAKEGRGQTKGIIGSAWYMAPEQCRGKPLDKRADIYALGIVLFELLTGRVPFSGPSSFEVMIMQVKTPMPRLLERRPDAPLFLEALLDKACAKEPDERFPSCEAFLDALRAGMASMGDGSSTAPGAPVSAALLPAGGTAPEPAQSMPSKPTDLALSLTPAPDNHTPDAPLIPAPPPAALPQPQSKSAAAVVGALAAVVVIAAALFYSKALSSNSEEPVASAPSGSGSVVSVQSATASASASAPPPAGIEGSWKSDTGRLYKAVWTGGAFEFRITNPAQFEGLDYEPGEPRFLLRPIEGAVDLFSVEDRIRPFSPNNMPFDSAKARPTCYLARTEVKGSPLRAELDGRRLRVRMAQVSPTPAMFEIERGRVVGCKSLTDAPAIEIDSNLTKQ